MRRERREDLRWSISNTAADLAVAAQEHLSRKLLISSPFCRGHYPDSFSAIPVAWFNADTRMIAKDFRETFKNWDGVSVLDFNPFFSRNGGSKGDGYRYATRPEYFEPKQIHLSEKGSKCVRRFIRMALDRMGRRWRRRQRLYIRSHQGRCDLWQ